MTSQREREDAIYSVERQFAAGSRDVLFAGHPTGFGVHRTIAAMVARRAGLGQRCLVLHPVPRLRIEDLKRCEPGLDVGKLGSGAAVEVASYIEVQRRQADVAPGGSRPSYDLLVMEEGAADKPDRVMAARKAYADVPALTASLTPPMRNLGTFDAASLGLPEAMAAALDGVVTVKRKDFCAGGGMADAGSRAFSWKR